MTAPSAVPPLGPGTPTAAAPLDDSAYGAAAHFESAPLAATVIDRLAGVCSEVATDARSCTEAARDWWPLGVVWGVQGRAPGRAAAVARPQSVAEVAAVLEVCHAARVPVTAAAGRSGVCGGSVPVFGGVVLDLTGLSGIQSYDDASLLVDVAAGTFGDHFEDSLRRDHLATTGHWPQSMALSTVGGWLACRSAGQYSTRYGKIEDMVVGLQVVLADGTVVRTGGRSPRAASGPDLTQLFVGSEGTLGVITSARLRVHPLPVAERRGAWGYASFDDGLDACRRIMRRGATPAVLRLYDHVESARHFDIPNACVLVVLDEGDPALVDGGWTVVEEECRSAEILDEALVERWLARRNSVADLGQLAAGGIVADTVEIAAPWSVLTALYHRAIAAVQALPDTLAVSAHQSHAYTDGACLYFTFAGRPDPDPGPGPGRSDPSRSDPSRNNPGRSNPSRSNPGRSNPGRAETYYRAAWDAVLEATLRGGGALSHHHGVGINRGRYMAEALDGGLPVLASIKAAVDPHGILNPGKLGQDSPWGKPPWPPT